MPNGQELWEQVKELLSGSIDQPAFEQIFKPITTIHKYTSNYIFIKVPNALSQFRIEKFYLAKMNELLSKLTNENIQFKIISKDEAIKEEQPSKEATPVLKEKVIKSRSLRAEYTFANFVTGEANREAFTFSTKVAESPNATINPFYIFGDVGLGKTHLMTAVGHYILENNPDANIVYTTAQQFVEDYFKSKNKNQKNTSISEDFDTYYRSADVLLVDDVQYLADRQGSQDEFFKLFEYLFENKKQMIITSDRPATELNIMARLKSRFSWGMQTYIKKPNLALRKSIIINKLKYLISDDSEISDDVITYIATNFDENVRELEGALRRFVSYCVSFNIDYSLENAEIALEAIMSKEKINNQTFNSNHVEKLKDIIAGYFNINVKELSSTSRKQEYVYARCIEIYLLRTKFNLSLNKIGTILGGRDHSTIAHAIDKIQKSLDTDSNVIEDVKNITQSLDKLYS